MTELCKNCGFIEGYHYALQMRDGSSRTVCVHSLGNLNFFVPKTEPKPDANGWFTVTGDKQRAPAKANSWLAYITPDTDKPRTMEMPYGCDIDVPGTKWKYIDMPEEDER